jgi:GAF domain-containing protein
MNRTVPLAGSLAGQAIRSGKPSLTTGDSLETAAAALGAGIGSLIAVPLAAGERVRGALLLGRLAARPGFTESDLDMAASFAGHAAVAMELVEARADQILLAQAAGAPCSPVSSAQAEASWSALTATSTRS